MASQQSPSHAATQALIALHDKRARKSHVIVQIDWLSLKLQEIKKLRGQTYDKVVRCWRVDHYEHSPHSLAWRACRVLSSMKIILISDVKGKGFGIKKGGVTWTVDFKSFVEGYDACSIDERLVFNELYNEWTNKGVKFNNFVKFANEWEVALRIGCVSDAGPAVLVNRNWNSARFGAAAVAQAEAQ
eukprot:349450_1